MLPRSQHSPLLLSSSTKGLAFKRRGAHILSYVYQFQGGLLKEPIAPAERERGGGREEGRESEKGETAEIEIVRGVMEPDSSLSIQPKIPQPIETSCPC